MTKSSFLIWLFLSVGWILFIGYGAITHWPQVPLDMSGADPSIDAAYREARYNLIVRALTYGLGGPAFTYLVMSAVDRSMNR